jgi:RHS repeat-associated protein
LGCGFPINMARNTKRHLADLGITNYGFHYYHPDLGRWLTRDPSGYAGGMNLYQFSAGNPLSYVDPDGQEPITIGGALFIIGGAWVAYKAIKKMINGIGICTKAKSIGEGIDPKAKGYGKTINELNDMLYKQSKDTASTIDLPGAGEKKKDKEHLFDGIKEGADWGKDMFTFQ